MWAAIAGIAANAFFSDITVTARTDLSLKKKEQNNEQKQKVETLQLK